MSATIVHSRPVGPQTDSHGSLSWKWSPSVGGDDVQSSKSSPAIERLSLSSVSESLPALAHTRSGSSPALAHSQSERGIGLGKDFVPEKAEMRRVFERFDENKDGLICAKDLNRFMGRLGIKMSDEEARSMLKSVDHNSDGCVDFEEFYSLYLSLNDDFEATDTADATDEEEDDTLLQVFRVFDANGDGVITPHELQGVLKRLGIPEGDNIRNCERMIQRVDSNGDEKIDIVEFRSMMCSSNIFQNSC